MEKELVILLAIVVGVPLLIVVWLIAIYNSLVRRRVQVQKAWAQIDVQLKRRYGLIPNLMETIKGYMAHERTVLENVTRARQQAIDVNGAAGAGPTASIGAPERQLPGGRLGNLWSEHGDRLRGGSGWGVARAGRDGAGGRRLRSLGSLAPGRHAASGLWAEVERAPRPGCDSTDGAGFRVAESGAATSPGSAGWLRFQALRRLAVRAGAGGHAVAPAGSRLRAVTAAP